MWLILTTSCVATVRSDCTRSKRRSRRFSRIRCWINRTIVILEIYDHCIAVLWGLHFHCQRIRGFGLVLLWWRERGYSRMELRDRLGCHLSVVLSEHGLGTCFSVVILLAYSYAYNCDKICQW